jgi:hypothetical protein
MFGVRPSPRMQGIDVLKLNTKSTFHKIQDMKTGGYTLKGCLRLDDGRLRLVFYKISDCEDCIFVFQNKFKLVRSFSAHL